MNNSERPEEMRDLCVDGMSELMTDTRYWVLGTRSWDQAREGESFAARACACVRARRRGEKGTDAGK